MTNAQHPAQQPLLTLANLTLGYDRHPAVHHLTGEVAPGSLLAIVGPNGAGKSTLLKAIAGVLTPMDGAIRFAQQCDIAYLPQAAEIERDFPMTVYEFIALGQWRPLGLFAALGAGKARRVAETIAAVGLAGFEHRAIGTLSGGQMQRMLFARLMLQDAPLILLDEPFTAIDQKTMSDLVDLIRQWQGEGRTIIAVLHDNALVAEVFPDALLLAREKVAWGPTETVLTRENLATARRMIEAFDDTADVCVRAA